MQESHQGLTVDLIIQYSIVGIILLGAFAWMVWKIVGMNKKNKSGGGCCGCSFADSCKKKEIKNYKNGNN